VPVQNSLDKKCVFSKIKANRSLIKTKIKKGKRRGRDKICKNKSARSW